MYLRRLNYRGKERGDTLVEVLISIAVVSVILGGAYVVSNHSLQATRNAQERSNALKLAEAQFEQMKGIVNDPATVNKIFGPGAPAKFCVNGSNVYTIPAQQVNCAVNSAGVPSGIQPVYTLVVTHAAGTNDFVLTETWTDVTGKATDHLQLNYRLYQ